jgi:protein-arginine deiminase
MNGNTSLPRYDDTHSFNNVNSILTDLELINRNNDIQLNYLDPILLKMKSDFGLEDSDVILIPSLFERCGGNSFNVALIPGMANLIVGNEPGEPIKLMVPDPFLRSNTGDQSSDPFIADFLSRMPASYGPNDIIFTDDWYVYHAALGEVHCGTNVRRTPSTTTWWDAADHLIN